MELNPGATVLNYRIVDKIGEGGMGVVWKAIDTTLDRTVAIKVLPEGFDEDADRLARFEREARSLAALNHPNVASLYGLHEVDGTRFITMEFVEGEDLALRIGRGALPAEEAVAVAIGIAEALTAAHAQGIVHRDLKPANVLLDTEGTPKVLDFGLAKSAAPEALSGPGSDPSASPTVTSLGTVAGVLLGTAAYMSPEQARGKPVDKRADTWALGCILLEMLTGKAPFAGDTISDTLASVLKTEPDWDALPATTPTALVRILKRSLSKNVRDRFQDAGDLRYELERALAEPYSEASLGAGPSPRRVTPLSVGLLIVGLLAGAIGGRFLLPPAPDDATGRAATISEISAFDGVLFGVTGVDLALSPDGSRLAYAATGPDGESRLYLRSLIDGQVKELPGTEEAAEPFWSPDGEEIGFHTGVHIKRIAPNDAQPRVIAEVGGTSGTWSRDGFVLYCPTNQGSLTSVDIETGAVTTIDLDVQASGNCDSVALLPDGKHYLIELTEGADTGVFVGTLGSTSLRRLIDLKTNAIYSAGHVLYHDGPRLLARPFDLDALELAGAPILVASPVYETNFPFHALFTAARDRPRVIYLEGTGESLKTELIWFDRKGREVERTGIVGDLYNPRLSADGRRLLLDVSTYETEGDIWLFDLARGSSRRLTDDPIDESQPQWSPDERAAYFFRYPDLYRVDLAGDGVPVEIHKTDDSKSPSDMSRHGMLAYHETGDNLSDIFYFDIESGEAKPWLATPNDEEQAEFSPDGEWLAYISDESGRWEVYIDRFPQRAERFRVSSGGGTNPTWSADGREIYYVSLTDDLVAVPVDLAAEGRPVGSPEILFRPKIRRDMFEPHPDGNRFLVVTRIDPEIDRAILVDDWN